MIDPGHGGHDHGATGPHGVKEKTLTLAISKQLATILRTTLDADVTLTRQDDRYIPLQDRNTLGNKLNADLFISVHANAAESPDPHGIETYYLNTASDKASKRLADRENRVFGKEISTLDKILTTMLQNANTDESRELAVAVQSSMIGGLSPAYPDVVDKHVKTALFYVLVGSKVPGILVETGFVSNSHEEKRLNSAKYQQQLAESIAVGVRRYLDVAGTRRRTL